MVHMPNPEVLFKILKTVPWTYEWGYWHPRTGHGIELMYPKFYNNHVCGVTNKCPISEPRDSDIHLWIKEYNNYYNPIWTTQKDPLVGPQAQ